MTTLDSPSTMTKKGKKSKITSRENWRKDLKFTEILMEGEVRGPETGDFSPFQLHQDILIREEIVTSLVIGQGVQMKNEGKANQLNGRKGQKSTAKQLGNAPSSDRAIKDIRQPLRRHTSG